jgi:CspA family cold shock protein
MTVDAVVREWHDDQGWGVVDAPQVPGGCWVGFGQVAVAGYRRLTAGQAVTLEWERARQDGYEYRAVTVWPRGAEPVRPEPSNSPDDAYSSTLTLSFEPDDI